MNYCCVKARTGENGLVSFFKSKKLLLSFLLMLFVSANANAYSQQNIALSMRNVTIKKVFDEIEKQTDYVFIFTNNLDEELGKKVSVNVKSASIENVLNSVIQNTGLNYRLLEKQIAVYKSNTPAVPKKHSEPAPVPQRVAPVQVPPVVITGVVTSSTGFVIPGATITVKGTKISAQSGVDGHFKIEVPDENVTLIISHISYKAMELPLKAGQTYYQIRMQEETQEIETVVVNGLFERKASSNTGATKTLSNEELKQVSVTNVFQAIAALDPAFIINPNNITGGNINELPDIQIRGANSLPNLRGELAANPNLPLFVLDGFEVSLTRIKDLDMNRISSITLLKDAAATAIYGSRAGNGVLVINTYAPKAGKIQATITNDFSVSTPDLSSYQVLNSFEKLEFEKLAGLYGTGNPVSDYNYELIYNERMKNANRGVNTDWMRIPTKTGVSNRTSVYLQGGDRYARYGVSLSGDLQSGVMREQNRRNYGAGFDLAYNLNKLLFKNSLSVFQNTSNESPFGSFRNYVGLNPYWAPYDQNGRLNRILENTQEFGQFGNPLYNATLNSINKNQYFGVRNNFSARYNFASRTYLETKFSIDKQTGQSDEFYSALDTRFASVVDANLKGSYSINNRSNLQLQSNTILNHAFSLGLHDIAAALGAEISSGKSNSHGVVAQGFPYDRLDNISFATQYQQNGRPRGDENTLRRIGGFGNLNYSFDNRYLFDFSLRREGSSQFGVDKQFNTFWSLGGGWNIHNEKFFKGNSNINRLKLRGSIGTTATLGDAAYNSQARYNFGESHVYNSIPGVNLINLANNQLDWQIVNQRNIGLDMTLFNNRLDFRTELYSNITENAITSIPIAASTGFSSYIGNLGRIGNKGIEISARYRVINKTNEGVIWSLFMNGIHNKNTLLKLSDKIKYINQLLQSSNSANVSPNTLLEEGQSTKTIFVVQSLGIDPVSGREIFLKKDGRRTFLWDVADKIAWGTTEPKLLGTFGSNLVYKGLELNLIFSYSFGAQTYNQTLMDKVENVDIRYNVDRRAYDLGWKKPGDISQFSSISAIKNSTKLTSRFVQDDNYVNMTSLSLGYNFYNHDFIKKMGFNSLQVTALTNDIFRAGSIRYERGIQNPFARVYALSVRLGF